MAVVSGYTTTYLDSVLDEVIVDAEVDSDGDLTFTKNDGSQLPMGNIKGPPGASITFINVVEVSGGSYELDYSGYNYTKSTSATANVIHIPAHSTTPIPVGSVFEGVQAGVGTTTITYEVGVTVLSYDDLYSLAGQNATYRLIKVDENEWVLSGNLV